MTATMPPDGAVLAADGRTPVTAHGSVSEAYGGSQGLNPTTSLSMIYLREFERTHSTMRGHVRIARKAGHMLRMHWAYVQCRRLAEWSES